LFSKCSILTGKAIAHGRPHIAFTDTVADTAHLIGIAVPEMYNLQKHMEGKT
jgi:hypothetical protein